MRNTVQCAPCMCKHDEWRDSFSMVAYHWEIYHGTRKGDEMKQWQVVQAILSISQCFVSHAARHGNAPVSGQTLFLLTSFFLYSHDARNQGWYIAAHYAMVSQFSPFCSAQRSLTRSVWRQTVNTQTKIRNVIYPVLKKNKDMYSTVQSLCMVKYLKPHKCIAITVWISKYLKK